MNSNKNTTLLIASFLAFALLATNVNVGAIYATGGLDDEEEEEAIQTLQNQVTEIKDAIGVLTLNLTQGSNNIQANCPATEDIVDEIKEVVENVTQQQPVQQNVTEQPSCPLQPQQQQQQQQNQSVISPPPPVIAEEPEPEQQPTCNLPSPPQQQNNQSFIPSIPQINITEPEEQNETAVVPEQNQTQGKPIICPLNGQIIGYEPVPEQNNTTTQQQTALPTEQQQQEEEQDEQPLQDEQEIATIEFEASCGCFVVDKSPQEVQ